VLRADVAGQADALRRLRDEARLLSRLNHPAILKVHDLVLLDGRVTLVTEYVDGYDLGTCASGPSPIGPRAVLQVIACVADALDAASQALALVHRDIKPSNIRLGRHGEVKLLDFGIARSDAVEREARTDSGLVLGSLPYMAPERFLDRAQAPAIDVFGLGSTLYELLSGERFYGSAVLRDVSQLALDERRYEAWLDQRIRALPTDLPRAIEELLVSMLDYDAQARPSERELAYRCEKLADGEAGPTLRMWSRDHTTLAGPQLDGALAGRTLTEGSLGLSTAPAPEPLSPARMPRLQRAPNPTVDDSAAPRAAAVVAPKTPSALRPTRDWGLVGPSALLALYVLLLLALFAGLMIIGLIAGHVH
jgi:serine/threonine protein kinase